jgi:hypothetical protein
MEGKFFSLRIETEGFVLLVSLRSETVDFTCEKRKKQSEKSKMKQNEGRKAKEKERKKSLEEK